MGCGLNWHPSGPSTMGAAALFGRWPPLFPHQCLLYLLSQIGGSDERKGALPAHIRLPAVAERFVTEGGVHCRQPVAQPLGGQEVREGATRDRRRDYAAPQV